MCSQQDQTELKLALTYAYQTRQHAPLADSMVTAVRTLSLSSPRLRPNVCPWGVVEVKLSAALRISSGDQHAIHVDLPCDDVDISALLPEDKSDCCAENNGKRQHNTTSLDVEVMGCDHGITFSIGTATLDMPCFLNPASRETPSRSTAFRLTLVDGARARVGMVSGAIVVANSRVERPTVPCDPVSTVAQDSKNDAPELGNGEHVKHKSNEYEGGAIHHQEGDAIEAKVAALLDLASNMLTKGTAGLTSVAAVGCRQNHREILCNAESRKSAPDCGTVQHEVTADGGGRGPYTNQDQVHPGRYGGIFVPNSDK